MDTVLHLGQVIKKIYPGPFVDLRDPFQFLLYIFIFLNFLNWGSNAITNNAINALTNIITVKRTHNSFLDYVAWVIFYEHCVDFLKAFIPEIDSVYV